MRTENITVEEMRERMDEKETQLWT